MPSMQKTQTLLKKLYHISQQHPPPKHQTTPEKTWTKKDSKIEEVLEIQQGEEEVSNEEELVDKLYIQDI